MTRFLLTLERIFKSHQFKRRQKDRTKKLKQLLLRLEALEARELLSVAPNDAGGVALASSLPTENTEDALIGAAMVDAQYLDTDGQLQTIKATVVNDSMKGDWQAGWYVVNNNVTILNADVCCKGDVKLILADGYSLTITGVSKWDDKNAGITVSGSDNRLTIYGQTKGSGLLKVTGGEYCAGIGGDNKKTGENITINGGTIIAQGGDYAAGIGGGYEGMGKNITINGGTVTATGGEKGAGIGGGNQRAGQYITINNGTVTAKGGIYGAGIGGGEKGEGQEITITGGTVTATGEKYAAGIGGGNQRVGKNITIKGGTITATGGNRGAGIGGGGSDHLFVEGQNGENITITGGTVKAQGGYYAAGIGGGGTMRLVSPKGGDGIKITIEGGDVEARGGYCGAGIGGANDRGEGKEITVSGGNVTAYGGEKGAGIGGGWHGNASNIAINGGTVNAYGGVEAAGIGGGCARSGSKVTANTGLIVRAGSNGGSTTVIANSGADLAGSLNGQRYAKIQKTDIMVQTSYLDENGKSVPIWAAAVDKFFFGDWQKGWYVVNSKVTLTNASVTCRGNVKLILAQGGELTITGAEDKAGINVSGKSNSLTIYGQANGSGALTATGGGFGAGIGGNGAKDGEAGENITINGGTVTAKGGRRGAGIGGGGGAINGGRAENITINGGTVTATGGYQGAGIGGGGAGFLSVQGKRLSKGGWGLKITINGGNVTANGGDDAAGIGGGRYGGGKDIKITGGTIVAKGKNGGAGIGGGHETSGKNIVISGGHITASGDISGAGIGGGDRQNGEGITISGGVIIASGGQKGAGIGGGSYGAAANISITGGKVTATSNASAIGSGDSYGPSKDITISKQLFVMAGENAAQAKEVRNSGGDLANALNKQKYVSVTQTAITNTYYLDENGKTRKINAAEIGSIMTGEWEAGWYVVNGKVTIENASILCKGSVQLILADGCSLTVKGADGKAGIGVSDAGSSLTIYCQSGKNGKLTATGGNDGAGIGGGRGQAGLNITIVGGIIEAQGGNNGAGIGGGNNGAGRMIKITGGTVNARGGNRGAGIGGGNNGAGRNITITGGTVKAQGVNRAAGIGGGIGDRSKPGKIGGADITITGGTVVAIGDEYAAGIGGGVYTRCKNIRITGGDVTAFSNAPFGTAIGNGLLSGYGRRRGIFVSNQRSIMVGYYYHGTVIAAYPIPNYGKDLTAKFRGKSYIHIRIPRRAEPLETSYIDENGETQTVQATVVDESMTGEWEAGWYVVNSDVTLDNASVTCKGDVKLILADGASLTVTGTCLKPGIGVYGAGNSLTVYGQAEGSGKLTATGGDGAAGIGGTWSRAGENITINGGTILAYGGRYAAGIGGGYAKKGDNIAINGGTVTAIGGGAYGIYGSGIGGGALRGASNITIHTELTIRAGDDEESAEELENSGGDLAAVLDDEIYVSITPQSQEDSSPASAALPADSSLLEDAMADLLADNLEDGLVCSLAGDALFDNYDD